MSISFNTYTGEFYDSDRRLLSEERNGARSTREEEEEFVLTHSELMKLMKRGYKRS